MGLSAACRSRFHYKRKPSLHFAARVIDCRGQLQASKNAISTVSFFQQVIFFFRWFTHLSVKLIKKSSFPEQLCKLVEIDSSGRVPVVLVPQLEFVLEQPICVIDSTTEDCSIGLADT